MNNIMTEEEEDSGGCLICFSKNENCDVLSDEESQKIINNCWKFLHENIENSKLQQTGNSIDDNQQECCKKCFDATAELIQLSEQVKKWKKQISDLKFEFSLGVMYRRTGVESINMKPGDSPKDFIMLDVSGISPSLFTIAMDQSTPTSNMMEDFELSENSCVQKDAVLNVLQPLFEIVKHESNESFDDDSLVLECTDEEGADKELIDNITSQIDDSRSAAVTDRGDTNRTKQLPACTKPVVLLKRIKSSSGVSNEFISTSCRQKPSITRLLRNKTSKKKSGPSATTTSSNIILGKSSGNVKKAIISGSSASTKVHERVGNGQKNHKCCFCEKVYCNSQHLENHIRVHTREKPFKCLICGKAFSELHNVKSHETIHTEEKPFKCSYCVKGFARSTDAKKHEKIHTGEKRYKCSFCVKGFSDVYGVKRHERIHTGEKPFKCSFCGKTFADVHNAKKHEKIHTVRKPFKCSYCGKTFAHLKDAETHERTHSNEISRLNVCNSK